jgi:streptogramin lyase
MKTDEPKIVARASAWRVDTRVDVFAPDARKLLSERGTCPHKAHASRRLWTRQAKACATKSAHTILWFAAAAAFAANVEHVARDIKLVEPFAVAFGNNGEWFICEHKGERIVRVDRAGRTAVIAGTGEPGNSGDGGPALKAMFRDPHGIVIRKNSEMYVADTLNHTVRHIDLKTAVIRTIAGTGERGFSGDGGPASKAMFNGTFAIALNASGDRLYVADLSNRRVRMIDLRAGTIQTVAGNGEKGIPADGAEATKSPLVDPRAVTLDSKGNLYILERSGNALRAVDTAGKIRTVIGPGMITPDLNGPKHLTVDSRDNVIIADAENHLIRRFDPKTNKTVTIAGTGNKGDHIDSDDPLRTDLNRPHGVAIDRSGVLYVSDSYNHRILKITKY